MNNTTSSGLYCWSSSSPHLPPTDHNNHNHNHHHVGMGMSASCSSEQCMLMSSDVQYLHRAYSPFDDASLSHSSASATFVDGCNNPLAIDDSTTTTNPRRYDEDGIVSTANSSAEWFSSLGEEDSTNFIITSATNATLSGNHGNNNTTTPPTTPNPKSSLSLLCPQPVSVDKYTDVMSQRNISYPYYTYNNYLNTTNSNNYNYTSDLFLPPAQAPRTCTTPHEWFYHHVVPSPWSNTAITADAAAAATAAAANPNNSMMMGAATNTVHDSLFPPFSVPFLAKSDVESNNYEYMNVPDNNNSALPLPFCNVNNSNLNFNFNLNLNFNNNPLVVRGDKQELFDSLKEAPHLNHRKKNNKTSVKRINKQTSKLSTPHTPTSTPTLASTVTNATVASTTNNNTIQQPIYSSATSLSALSVAEEDINDHNYQKQQQHQQPHLAVKQEKNLVEEPVHNKYHSSPSVMQSEISTTHSVKKKKSTLPRKRGKRSRKEMENEVGNNDMDNNNNDVEMNTKAGEAIKNGTSTAPKAKKFKRVALSEPKLIRHKKFPFICEQTHLDVPLDGSTNNNNGFFRCCMTLECGLLCGQTFHQKSHWARHCKKLHAYAAQ